MCRVMSRDDVRAFDRRAIEELGVPGVVLMENAGRGAAELLLALGVRGPVAVACGKGNNGGDGFVIARRLRMLGREAGVLLFCQPDELHGDSRLEYEAAARSGTPIVVHPGDSESLRAEFGRVEWIVDALFGTGLQGSVRPPFDQVIERINASGAKVFAVDIPSGLDCDTGLPLGPCVRAAHTATFVAMKKGFIQPGARKWTGRVHVLDIGVANPGARTDTPGGERL